MSDKLRELIPDPDALLNLAPEELGYAVLEALKAERNNQHQPYSFIQFLFEGGAPIYPREYRERVFSAILEAWTWLESTGLIADRHEPSGPELYFVTKRGGEIKSKADFKSFREAISLPKHLIHSTIASKAWGNFLRGDFDTAVFQAFKEVEERVRAAGGYAKNHFGEKLMRAAFDKDKGPLTDKGLPEAERIGLQNLFAGAIGAYKNAHSHRTVAIDDPVEAFEMMEMASHLLRIVDARSNGES